MVMKDGDRFRAWYDAASAWTTIHETLYPVYSVRHAESVDGVRWSDAGPWCIERADDEFGIARPWVVRDPALLSHVVLDPLAITAVPDRLRGIG